jgi:hypothetical protein
MYRTARDIGKIDRGMKQWHYLAIASARRAYARLPEYEQGMPAPIPPQTIDLYWRHRLEQAKRIEIRLGNLLGRRVNPFF